MQGQEGYYSSACPTCIKWLMISLLFGSFDSFSIFKSNHHLKSSGSRGGSKPLTHTFRLDIYPLNIPIILISTSSFHFSFSLPTRGIFVITMKFFGIAALVAGFLAPSLVLGVPAPGTERNLLTPVDKRQDFVAEGFGGGRGGSCNSPNNRQCWTRGFDINTDYELGTPNTGNTRRVSDGSKIHK